jgi:hypothetical protein
MHGKMRNVYKILVRNCEGKRPLGRPMHICEDNFRKDLREKGWEGVDWVHLAQNRDQWWALANMVMKFQVP